MFHGVKGCAQSQHSDWQKRKYNATLRVGYHFKNPMENECSSTEIFFSNLHVLTHKCGRAFELRVDIFPLSCCFPFEFDCVRIEVIQLLAPNGHTSPKCSSKSKWNELSSNVWPVYMLYRCSIESTNPKTNQTLFACQMAWRDWMISSTPTYQYFPCKYQKWEESMQPRLLRFESIHHKWRMLLFSGIWLPIPNTYRPHLGHHLDHTIWKKKDKYEYNACLFTSSKVSNWELLPRYLCKNNMYSHWHYM